MRRLGIFLDKLKELERLQEKSGARFSARKSPPLTSSPVLVAGIGQRRVCGAEEFNRPKDLGRPDSCDKRRNEGVSGSNGVRLRMARHFAPAY
ncbi:hypothetical protein C7U60_03820 [Mesorhizobium plurifarium]|nr:hypothetical protein C7U60_03820 [Mesorhizobium plurifarium]